MDSPLRKLGDRVVLSPHSASYTEGGELRQGVAWATQSVITALNGGIPDNVYNREVIPRWKERFARIQAEMEAIPPHDTSSRFLRDRQFWGEEGFIQPGKVVGWIFATEEQGARMK